MGAISLSSLPNELWFQIISRFLEIPTWKRRGALKSLLRSCRLFRDIAIQVYITDPGPLRSIKWANIFMRTIARHPHMAVFVKQLDVCLWPYFEFETTSLFPLPAPFENCRKLRIQVSAGTRERASLLMTEVRRWTSACPKLQTLTIDGVMHSTLIHDADKTTFQQLNGVAATKALNRFEQMHLEGSCPGLECIWMRMAEVDSLILCSPTSPYSIESVVHDGERIRNLALWGERWVSEPWEQHRLVLSLPNLRTLSCRLSVAGTICKLPSLHEIFATVVFNSTHVPNPVAATEAAQTLARAIGVGNFPRLQRLFLRVVDIDDQCQTMSDLVKDMGLDTACEARGALLEIVPILDPWDLNSRI